MNLTKYDAQGFPYTDEEAFDRAEALFKPRYLARGYSADPADRLRQARIKPYNVGRNAAKRAAKAQRAQLRGNLK